MRPSLSFLAILVLTALPAFGQGVNVAIDGPATATGGFALVGNVDNPDAVLRWSVESPDGAHPLELLDSAGRPVLVFMSPPDGVYRVWLSGQVPVDGLDPFSEILHTVTKGDSKPEPEPDDKDVEPEPDGDSSPIATDKLHVLVVYESGDATSLTSDQRDIIYGAESRQALQSFAPDRFRIYDQDIDLEFAPKEFREAMGVKRDSLPWLVMGNGKSGFSGPLDMTPAEFQKLLETHK